MRSLALAAILLTALAAPVAAESGNPQSDARPPMDGGTAPAGPTTATGSVPVDAIPVDTKPARKASPKQKPKAKPTAARRATLHVGASRQNQASVNVKTERGVRVWRPIGRVAPALYPQVSDAPAVVDGDPGIARLAAPRDRIREFGFAPRYPGKRHPFHHRHLHHKIHGARAIHGVHVHHGWPHPYTSRLTGAPNVIVHGRLPAGAPAFAAPQFGSAQRFARTPGTAAGVTAAPRALPGGVGRPPAFAARAVGGRAIGLRGAAGRR